MFHSFLKQTVYLPLPQPQSWYSIEVAYVSKNQVAKEVPFKFQLPINICVFS